MGYWQEKKQYEEERKDKDFCSICGRALTSKNVKGKCVECSEVVCNNCGKVQEGKIVCSDCKGGKYKGGGGFFDKIKWALKQSEKQISRNIKKGYSKKR